jgi:hypothetical protein
MTATEYRALGRGNVKRPNLDSTEKESFAACHIYILFHVMKINQS